MKQISELVKPIMKIPDHIISKKDKAITALTVANLLEGYTTSSSLFPLFLSSTFIILHHFFFHCIKFFFLYNRGQAVDSVVVEFLRDMVYELVQASFYSSKFTYATHAHSSPFLYSH